MWAGIYFMFAFIMLPSPSLGAVKSVNVQTYKKTY